MSGPLKVCKTTGTTNRAGALVCLRPSESIWQLQQPTNWTCGPTCALFLILRGEGSGTAGVAKGQEAAFIKRWLDAGYIKSGQGTGTDEILGILNRHGMTHNGAGVERWEGVPVHYEQPGKADGFLDRNLDRFMNTLLKLLGRSPRGVACQFVIPADGEGPLETSKGGSHWVVAVGVEKTDGGAQRVLYYDPEAKDGEHLLSLSAREFLAGHVKGVYLEIDRSGENRSATQAREVQLISPEGNTVLLAAAGRRTIAPGAALFDYDTKGSSLTQGQDLSSKGKPLWTSFPSSAEARAQAIAKRGSAALVLEYGQWFPLGSSGAEDPTGELFGGAFCVVELEQELDAAESKDWVIDEDGLFGTDADSPAHYLGNPEQLKRRFTCTTIRLYLGSEVRLLRTPRAGTRGFADETYPTRTQWGFWKG